MNKVVSIAKKELKDTVRDRRTLLVMLVLPIALMPLMFVGLQKLTQWQAENAEKATVRVAINEASKELTEVWKRDKRMKVVESDDPAADVGKDKADVGLVLPSGFGVRLEQGKTATVRVFVDHTNPTSMGAESKIIQTIESLNEEILIGRLAAVGLDSQALRPIVIESQNVATDREMGGRLLGLALPLMLVIWAIIGGMYTAIDLSAGERERNSLESLLLTPAKRSEIVLGKFLGVFIVSLTTVILATSSMYITLQRIPLFPTEAAAGAPDIEIALAPGPAALILLVALLVAAFFSALMLAIGIFAQNFKEGQNYITPLLFLALLPTMILSAMPEIEFGWPVFLIPVFNAMLTFRELVAGHIEWINLFLTLASSAVFAALALVAATYIFSQEKVIFRS